MSGAAVPAEWPAPLLAVTRRTRSTPWSDRVEAAGVRVYTTYNHMLLPSVFRGLEEDYHHLRRAVQVWDVGCQRQVELDGPDAGRLAQMLTVRDLRDFGVGRSGLAPIVDHEGMLLNDPVVLRVAADRWWFSISDLDIALWAGGIAHGAGLDVAVREPDVWPLAVQGPRAEELMSRVFGESVRSLAYFRFVPLAFRGREMLVSRSGWSAQGGFEVYVDDAATGVALWDDLMAAGGDLEVGPGCPNLIERIEAGLLTYGTDITREDTPLEAGMERYCALDAPIAAIGLAALRARAARGIDRRIAGLRIEGPRVPHQRNPWPVSVDARPVGRATSTTWSPRLGHNVGVGMLAASAWGEGTRVVVHAPDGDRQAEVVPTPFPGASQRARR
jgi:dimethylsulfoniopropionate demethylase